MSLFQNQLQYKMQSFSVGNLYNCALFCQNIILIIYKQQAHQPSDMIISPPQKSNQNLNHYLAHYDTETQKILHGYKPLDNQSICQLFKIQKAHIYQNLIGKRQLTESQPCRINNKTKQKSNDFFVQSAKIEKTMRKQSKTSNNSNSQKIKSQLQEYRPSLFQNRIRRRLFQLQQPHESHHPQLQNRFKTQSLMEGEQFNFLDQLKQCHDKFETKVFIEEINQSDDSSQETHMDHAKTGKKARNQECSNVFSNLIPIKLLTCKNIELLNAPKKSNKRIKTVKLINQQYLPEQPEITHEYLNVKRTDFEANEDRRTSFMNVF